MQPIDQTSLRQLNENLKLPIFGGISLGVFKQILLHYLCSPFKIPLVSILKNTIKKSVLYRIQYSTVLAVTTADRDL